MISMVVPLGATFGSLFGSKFISKGRRKGLMLLDLITILGNLVTMIKSLETFMLG